MEGVEPGYNPLIAASHAQNVNGKSSVRSPGSKSARYTDEEGQSWLWSWSMLNHRADHVLRHRWEIALDSFSSSQCAWHSWSKRRTTTCRKRWAGQSPCGHDDVAARQSGQWGGTYRDELSELWDEHDAVVETG